MSWDQQKQGSMRETEARDEPRIVRHCAGPQRVRKEDKINPHVDRSQLIGINRPSAAVCPTGVNPLALDSSLTSPDHAAAEEPVAMGLRFTLDQWLSEHRQSSGLRGVFAVSADRPAARAAIASVHPPPPSDRSPARSVLNPLIPWLGDLTVTNGVTPPHPSKFNGVTHTHTCGGGGDPSGRG